MLEQAFNVDKTTTEAVVLAVDVDRNTCSVKTFFGMVLNDVMWLSPSGGTKRGGFQFMPNMGDRVLVCTATGYPIILGSIPTCSADVESYPTEISGESAVSIEMLGSDIPLSMTRNPSRPRDLLPGDQFLTSEGGGMIGVTRTGSILMKASQSCQILVSKIDRLMRIVSKTLEIYTGVASEIYSFRKGNVFKYIGWAGNLKESRSGLFPFEQIIGNTKAGRELRSTPNVEEFIPENETLFEERILDWDKELTEEDIEKRIRMKNTYDRTGKSLRQVIDENSTTVEQTSEVVTINFTAKDAGKFATVTVNGTQISIDFNGKSKATFTEENVVVEYVGKAKATLNETVAKLERGADVAVTLTDDKVEAKKGGSTLELTDASSLLKSGGHSIAVSSGGVVIS